MEGYEARYMQAFLAESLAVTSISSLVLRHDGFYCMPVLQETTVEQCARHAATAVGMPGLQVKLSLLREARASALREVYEGRGHNTLVTNLLTSTSSLGRNGGSMYISRPPPGRNQLSDRPGLLCSSAPLSMTRTP